MTPERWQQIGRLFHAALELENGPRADFLEQACGADCDLRREVESLISSGAAAGSFIEAPAIEVAARALADNSSILALQKDVVKSGATISHYQILEKLGAGGMGEVYRAHDTKLNRDVALKFLTVAAVSDRRPAMGTSPLQIDSQALERFRREARMLAALNHPNIAAIYGLEESGVAPALVMELVEGPTLADLIESRNSKIEIRKSRKENRDAKIGPNFEFRISSFDVLAVARQMAEALEYAHEKGIIHRDLKPANIKVKPEGAVKVLDFGLAKLARGTGVPPVGTDEHGPDARATQDWMTEPGMIMGTAAYMSPEQARGQAVDRRSDIWSFGCVLYEMLAGQPAYGRETLSDTLAAVLKTEPNWDALPKATPPSIQKLIARCLTKDPKQRLQAIGDARITIEETLSGIDSVAAGLSRQQEGGGVKPPLRKHAGILRALPWVAGIALGSILTGLIVWRLLSPQAPAPRPVTRFALALPSGDELWNTAFPALALSPDGSELVYAAGHGDVNQLYLRSLNQMEAKPIAGTEDASNPFFSPDGQWIGFFAGGNLKKVSIQGGPPMTICDTSYYNLGSSWGADNTIVFTGLPNSRLFRVSAAGGTPRPVTTVNFHQGEFAHRWPQVLPGGEVLFSVSLGGSWDNARIEIASLKTGERRVLVEGGTYPRYVAPGYIVYSHGGEVVAVPFDLKQLKVTGPPAPVLESVRVDPTSGAAQFTISENGSVAYAPGGAFLPLTTLLWVDRNGKEEPIAAPPRPYTSAHLSPDGRRVAIWIGHYGANSDIWTYDLARRTLTRLTTDGDSSNPAWSPDGKRVVYSSVREQGRASLFWANPDGSGEERLTSSEWAQVRPSFSPDGRFLAFVGVQLPTGHHDIQILPLEGNRKPQPVLQTQFEEDNPMFSPDGHWIAYVSNETGRREVYIRPYPGPGEKLQVSTQGGGPPVWSRDGRELFYRSGNKMMAVAVSTGPALKLGEPQVLFEGDFSNWYDVAPDGKKFLMIKAQPSPPVTQINVVENWIEDLKHAISTNARP